MNDRMYCVGIAISAEHMPSQTRHRAVDILGYAMRAYNIITIVCIVNHHHRNFCFSKSLMSKNSIAYLVI